MSLTFTGTSSVLCGLLLSCAASAQQGYAVLVPDHAVDDAAAWLDVGEVLAAHRGAKAVIPIRPDDLDAAMTVLRELAPKYAAFVVPPQWIDDTFVGRVFEHLTRFDDDPLLDCAHGFITGRTAADARQLIERTIAAEREPDSIPRKFVGIAHTFAGADLGPFATEQAAIHQAHGYEAAAIIGVDDSEHWQENRAEAVKQLNGASLIFAAGHGMGDWFCAIEGELLRDISLEAAIVVNGTCHSATTLLRHDIDGASMGIVKQPLNPNDSIALNFIAAGAIAQLGSTASSSWMNVGLAIDSFYYDGQSMGESLMRRLNQHMEQHGISSFRVIPFVEGQPSPQFLGERHNPGHIQSISRVILLGDPAYAPFPGKRQRIAVELPREIPARARRTIEQLIADLDDPELPMFSVLNELIARGADAVDPLIDAMKTSSNWQMVKALGAIGDDRAIDPLIDKLATDATSPTREIVVEALELITGERLGTDASAWRAWRRR